MTSINFKSLSSLSPIELKYQYQRNEDLDSGYTTYKTGFTTFNVTGFKNYQDVTINKNSLLLLTSTINLSTVFTPTKKINLGTLPGSIYLQPRNFEDYLLYYNPSLNKFKIDLNKNSVFHISPIAETKEVELFVDNKFVQVDKDYPYTVRLNSKSLDPESIHRQRFEIVFNDNKITFKTLTDTGFRYLALNNDNVLRAVGLILGNTAVNDYIFNAIPITTTELAQGFTPDNNWVTYFFDVESKINNKNLELNKILSSTQTNLLVDLPIETAAGTGSVNINIANLKTGLTPGGGPAPVDNTYSKEQLITTN